MTDDAEEMLATIDDILTKPGGDMVQDVLVWKAKALDDLDKCLGYVMNGTDTNVSICLDDATVDYTVTVGTNRETRRTYHHRNLVDVLRIAAKGEGQIL